MVERPKKVTYNDKMVDAVDVPIREAVERSSEITLEDGTVIRVKAGIASATRLVGEYDAVGNPVYTLDLSAQFQFVVVPDNLKKS
jgi:hypothetical protein